MAGGEGDRGAGDDAGRDAKSGDAGEAPDNLLPPGAEGHADANFAPAIDDAARENAVGTGGDEGEGENCKASRDVREQSLLAEVVVDGVTEEPAISPGFIK